MGVMGIRAWLAIAAIFQLATFASIVHYSQKVSSKSCIGNSILFSCHTVVERGYRLLRRRFAGI
jgi:hypothetical protein